MPEARSRINAADPAAGRAHSRLVGILGGMGPAATADFYAKLVAATPAEHDQDHLRVVMWADPTVPNRHAALRGEGEDPRPWLAYGIDQLIASGAELLVVPCNTVHAFLPEVTRGKKVEFISIIDTAMAAVAAVSRSGAVGVIGADGAIESGLYQKALLAAGMTPVLLGAESQAELMRVIYAIKAGSIGDQERQVVGRLLDDLVSDGATSIIAGCTEVSILLAQVAASVSIIDPSMALAIETVARATGPGNAVD